MNLLSNAIDALEDGHQKQRFNRHFEDPGTDSQPDAPAPATTTQGPSEPAVASSAIAQNDASTVELSHSPKEWESSVEELTNSAPVIRIRTEIIDNSADGHSSTPRVVIRIIDNGPGIPEDVKARIFDPFFTTKPVGKGTGLGLSISYQIVVEKHKGQLSCISAPNRGTEFRVEIPLCQ
jgi:signal transduction histidine kinase